MAYVALPTGGLALADSERYLPDLLTALEDVPERNALGQAEITIRMTGLSVRLRPYLAEIGLVGRRPGSCSLYLGAPSMAHG
jgi:sulfite reductase (NADPH) hemoprotein beta-component